MKYLVCNLKANKTKEEYIAYEKEISKILINPDIELIICPSTPFLYLFQSQNYKLGSQDISSFDLGPHTGENVAEQLASLNVKYTLIGHSERRTFFQEEESILSLKIKKAYHNHIRPIYFIGEPQEAKNNAKTEETIFNQITRIIDEVPDYKRENILLVYEPVWAIGTGLTPSIEEILVRINFIKQILNKKYNLNLPILYGGSVNEANIETLMSINTLNGFVLGESSKEISNLIQIYNKIQKNINKLDKK